MRTIVVLALAGALAGCGGNSPTGPGSNGSPSVQTIAELTFANPVQIQAALLAQSVTLPAGSFNALRFRFILAPSAPPLTGSVYILSQEYLGLVSALGTAPGLVARSIRIEGDEFVFDTGVTLAGEAKYWFASDFPIAYLRSQSTSDVYPGGDLYGTGSLTGGPSSFLRFWVFSPNERLDASFTLRGARVQ